MICLTWSTFVWLYREQVGHMRRNRIWLLRCVRENCFSIHKGSGVFIWRCFVALCHFYFKTEMNHVEPFTCIPGVFPWNTRKQSEFGYLLVVEVVQQWYTSEMVRWDIFLIENFVLSKSLDVSGVDLLNISLSYKHGTEKWAFNARFLNIC